MNLEICALDVIASAAEVRGMYAADCGRALTPLRSQGRRRLGKPGRQEEWAYLRFSFRFNGDQTSAIFILIFSHRTSTSVVAREH